ncbi:MAG: hypothetical protein KGQ70_00325 [Alphaproteobacteria bacterium]|nr:hypothetical protein [Alphaproteobacteria bacterium]
MKKTLFVLAALAMSQPAPALAKPVFTAAEKNSAPVKTAEEPNDLGITQQDCENLVNYQTPPGVDYQPGVDADGNPVVPADITPSPVTLPETYSFTLNVDAAKYLGLTVPAGSQGLMPVGKVTVDTKTGAATWNGQPMEGEAVATLKDWCAKHPPQTPENGQNGAEKPAK